MNWLQLVLAGYATLLLLGLAALLALGALEPLALQWAVLEVAIGLALGLMIVLASGAGEKPRGLRRQGQPRR